MSAVYHFIKKKRISKGERAESPSPETQPLEHTSNTYPERNWKGFATQKVVGDQLAQKIGFKGLYICKFFFSISFPLAYSSGTSQLPLGLKGFVVACHLVCQIHVLGIYVT